MKKKVKKKTTKKKQHPVLQRELSFGQKAADILTKFAGSWTFIIIISILIMCWITLNSLALIHHWDPWPFIILNLVLSCLAAMQAPIILMSQNRQTERDRIQVKYDYQIDRKSLREISKVAKDIHSIKTYMYGNKKLSSPKKIKRKK